jgi:protein tyrosine/serine phosphatase
LVGRPSRPSPAELLPRALAWEGCLNVRDLGGHRTEDGVETAHGAVVRADSVRRLSPAGWEALVAYGVGRIVDLRFHDELAADPPGSVPVEVVHVPVLPDPAAPDWQEIDAVAKAAADDADATAAVYLEFLRRYPEGFARAVAAVAGAPAGPVVVHCMVGKDRTGLVAALLLRLAGVPVAEVAADYALSERNLAALSQPWIEEAEDDVERARRRRMAATPAAAMTHVLAELGRSGGEERYLREAGVTADEIEAVRARLRR